MACDLVQLKELNDLVQLKDLNDLHSVEKKKEKLVLTVEYGM